MEETISWIEFLTDTEDLMNGSMAFCRSPMQINGLGLLFGGSISSPCEMRKGRRIWGRKAKAGFLGNKKGNKYGDVGDPNLFNFHAYSRLFPSHFHTLFK
jgi:hypothetical protein